LGGDVWKLPPLYTVGGEVKWCGSENMEIPPKIINRINMAFSNFISGYIPPKKIENKVLKRFLYSYVHGKIIHSSQKVEVSTMSKQINCFMQP
jgi:hypothetical protein